MINNERIKFLYKVRGKFLDINILNDIFEVKSEYIDSAFDQDDLNIDMNSYLINTNCRFCIISPYLLGFKIFVYNGRKYIPLKIVEDFIGYKLGDLVPTKKFIAHKKNKKKRAPVAKKKQSRLILDKNIYKKKDFNIFLKKYNYLYLKFSKNFRYEKKIKSTTC